MRVFLFLVLLPSAIIHAGLLFFGGLYVIEFFGLSEQAPTVVLMLLSVLSLGGLAYLPLLIRAFMLKLPTDEVAQRRSRRSRNR
ncbi:MAG: hypothetical protein ACFB21_01275 [Opitutales bacterium]